jgi:hypothetical protein
VGVNQVRISLKRLSNNTYWSGSSSGSGFSSTFRYWDTTLDTPGGTSTGWTWSWTPRSSTVPGDFQILVQAVDAAGNVDNSTPNVRFTVSNVPPDTVAPDTVLSTPTEGESFPTGPVSITGSATDNVSVQSVQVRITNSVGQFWTGTTWSATNSFVTASLATAGTTSSTWSYNFIANAADTYSVTATAVDGSGAVDASPAGPVGFSTVGSGDTTNPGQVVVTAPLNNSTTTGGTVTITGTATDDVGVTEVRVRIRLNPGTTWWNGTSFGPYAFVVATLASPGAPSTTWSYTFTPPAPGNFGLQVFAVDAVGHAGANSVWRTFNVAA